MRYLLELAYDGTNYHGWQIQPNANTVQAEVNKALSTILRQEITTMGSGRTDAGVHASQQFVHFDCEKELDELIIGKLNSISPKDIAFYSIRKVNEEFNARFNAVNRSYTYFISPTKNPFKPTQCYRFARNLNIELMNEACRALLRHTDFECFSKVHTDVNHFNCTITKAHWFINGNDFEFHITANRFLRGMVRAIVGTLLDVGEGKISVEDFERIILSKDRKQAGKSAPACGLFLCEVLYNN